MSRLHLCRTIAPVAIVVGCVLGTAPVVQATEGWSSAGSMAAKRSQQTATLLSNGTVLVAGLYELLLSRDDGNSWTHLGAAQMGTAWYEGVAASTSQTSTLLVGLSGRIARLRY